VELRAERARVESGAAEMGVKAEGIPRVYHHGSLKTPASLGHSLSVFNNNSTLKPKSTRCTYILSCCLFFWYDHSASHLTLLSRGSRTDS